MVMFNSYAKLPEGNTPKKCGFKGFDSSHFCFTLLTSFNGYKMIYKDSMIFNLKAPNWTCSAITILVPRRSSDCPSVPQSSS